MFNKTISPGSAANGQGTSAARPETGSGDGAVAGVSRELHSFVADIEDLVKATTSLTGEDLARAKAKLGERIAAAKQSVEEIGGVIVDRARHTVKVTDGYVHKQPWQAIGIGAALGLLVGFVLARRV